MQRQTTEIGDIVSFQTKMTDGAVRGTVVSKRFYPWCTGASTITVYSSATKALHDLPMFAGAYTQVKASTPDEADFFVRAARVDYEAHLAQYPAWQENFKRGISVGF